MGKLKYLKYFEINGFDHKGWISDKETCRAWSRIDPKPIFFLTDLFAVFNPKFSDCFSLCLHWASLVLVLIFKLYSSENNNCGYSNAIWALQGILSSKICVICSTRCFKTKSYFCEKLHIFETFSFLLLVLVQIYFWQKNC